MKDTKEKLLEASQKLFTVHGFKKASVDEIVQSAGVAKGTFYIYFPSKEDLYQELMKRNIKTILTPKMIPYLKDEKNLQMLIYKKTILALSVINKNKLLKELFQNNPNYTSQTINAREIKKVNQKLSAKMFEKAKKEIRPDLEIDDLIEISIGVLNLMLDLETKVKDYWKTIHSLNKIFIDGILQKTKPWDEKKCWGIINEVRAME